MNIYINVLVSITEDEARILMHKYKDQTILKAAMMKSVDSFVEKECLEIEFFEDETTTAEEAG